MSVLPELQFPYPASGNNSNLPYRVIVETPCKGVRERTLQTEKLSLNTNCESPYPSPNAEYSAQTKRTFIKLRSYMQTWLCLVWLHFA